MLRVAARRLNVVAAAAAPCRRALSSAANTLVSTKWVGENNEVAVITLVRGCNPVYNSLAK
jgi:hypothetical protein